MLQDASSKGVLIVCIEHRHGFLYDDRAMIEFLIYEVDCASGDFHPVGDGMPGRVSTVGARCSLG